MQRAAHLKPEYPFAAEILAFYERICELQQSLSAELQPLLRKHAVSPGSNLREQIDLDLVLPFAESTLKALSADAPGPIAEYIADFLRGSQNRRGNAFQKYIDEGGQSEAREDSLGELIAAGHAER